VAIPNLFALTQFLITSQTQQIVHKNTFITASQFITTFQINVECARNRLSIVCVAQNLIIIIKFRAYFLIRRQPLLIFIGCTIIKFAAAFSTICIKTYEFSRDIKKNTCWDHSINMKISRKYFTVSVKIKSKLNLRPLHQQLVRNYESGRKISHLLDYKFLN